MDNEPSYYKICPKTKAVQSIDLNVKVGSSYDPQLNNETIDFDGVIGSQTVYQGAGGGELKITPVFELNKKDHVKNIKKLEKWYMKGTELTLTYATGKIHSGLMMGGNYIITDVNVKENNKQIYEVDLTLQKQITYPVLSKHFTNWKPKKKKKPLKGANKTPKSSNYNKLKKCIPLYKDHAGKNKSTSCDLIFQKILRSYGFYIKYKNKNLKLDGYYGIYTQDACIKFQKKYKIPVTGKCDKNTLKKIGALMIKSQSSKSSNLLKNTPKLPDYIKNIIN
ncbi:peptidoglycan-binding domain-containing protein [Methanobrevibacter filiformis]|nr:peptidoglycan-binding domain-containing protein [Methanobrevibacter filiformis]